MRIHLALTTAFGLGLGAALTACGPNETHPPRDAYEPADLQPLACLPDLDGKVEPHELAPAFGATAHYLVPRAGRVRAVELAGRVDAAGRRLWDWSRPEADDQVAATSAAELSAQWYANEFPSGEFVSPLDLAGRIEGVYRHDEDGLKLLGYASKGRDPLNDRTLVKYAQPVVLYRFPLEDGQQWVSVGQVADATVRGLPYAGRDVYELRVDGTGRLALPELEFTQVHRVRMKVSITPAVGMNIVRRQVSFVAECFGEVARATSRDDETQDDFTEAAEVRRLGIGG